MPTDFTVVADYPVGVLEPANVAQTFQSQMEARLRRQMEHIVDVAAENTKSKRVAESYSVEMDTRGGELVAGAVNTSDIFNFVEEDTVVHWAPWGEGTPLAEWAQEHGIVPFLVARKIARVGTEGDHALEQAWEQGVDGFSDQIDDGFAEWLGSYGTAGA